MPRLHTAPLSATAPSSLLTCLAQILDLLARSLGVVQTVNGLRTLIEFLAQIGEGSLELAQLPGEFIICGARFRRRALPAAQAPRPGWPLP